MATREISVRTLQRGLTVWNADGPDAGATDPGPVDGAWGPRTHEALRMFVSFNAPRLGLDAARVLAPLRTVPVGVRTIPLEGAIAQALHEIAQGYTAPGGGGGGAPPPVVRSGGGAGSIVVGLLVGAAVFGGAAWYFLREK